MNLRLSIVALLLIAAYSGSDYCQVISNPSKMFMTAGQTRFMPIGDYIKGSNIAFSTQQSKTNATIYDPFHINQEIAISAQGYTLKNVDVLTNADKEWLGLASLFGVHQNDSSKITLWSGKMNAGGMLPEIEQWRNYTLPESMNCFDAKLINLQEDIAVNCQTSQEDVICVASKDTTVPLKCKSYPSLGKASYKKTYLFYLGSSKYLLTHHKDLVEEEEIQYFTIYKHKSDNTFEFGNIIDKNLFNLEKIEISGVDFLDNGQIVMSDAGNGLVTVVEYSMDNKVKVSGLWMKQFKPSAVSVTQQDTILVATETGIEEVNQEFSNVRTYQIDQSDTPITYLSSNKNNLFAKSSKNILYIYERSQTSLKYLEDKVSLDQGTIFNLRNFQKMYHFTPQKMIAVQLTNFYLGLNNVGDSEKLKIIGKSGDMTCSVEVEVQFVKDVEDIVVKENLEETGFIVDSVEGLSLDLDSYFGGANLQYSLNKSQNEDLNVKLQHVSSYSFTPTFKKMQHTTIIQVEDKGFYYVGVSTFKDNQIKIDWCPITQDQIKCQLYHEAQNSFGNRGHILYMTSRIRKNGDVIFAWTYQDMLAAVIFNVSKKKQILTTYSGEDFNYNSVVIGQEKQYFVSKQTKSIFVFDTKGVSINAESFTEKQLEALEQFYPREVYEDQENSNVFYVKLPTKLAKMSIDANSKPVILGVMKVLDQYIPNDKWSLSFQKETIIGVFPDGIKEFSKIFDETMVPTQKLNNKPYNGQLVASSNSPIVIAKSSTNENNNNDILTYLRPSQGSLDLQYFKANVQSSSILTPNWVVNSNTMKATYLENDPKLIAKSDLSDETFKEDSSFSIGVNGSKGKVSAKTEVEAVNYPVIIKEKKSKNSAITFPQKSSKGSIPLAISDYFNGSILDVKADCPYCEQNIKLTKPIFQVSTIDEIQNAMDFVHYGHAHKIIALTKSKLFMIDNSSKVVGKQIINSTSECTNFFNGEKLGLLVYCQSSSEQQIIKYTVSQNEFKYNTTYSIPNSNPINNFDQMFGMISQDGHKYIYILDNNEYKDTNKKASNVKIYEITDQGLKFLQEVNSMTFGLTNLLPINDIEFVGKGVVLATLGNYGIGYGIIENGKVVNGSSINLKNDPTIKQISIDNSFFKQIEYISSQSTDQEIKILLTTTTSLNMVIVLQNKSDKWIYKRLCETYFRYGSQRLLNWNVVTKNKIILSFYNSSSETATIVTYPRKENNRSHFIAGVQFSLPNSLMKYHEAIYTSSDQLYISNLVLASQNSELRVYNTTNGYNLKLSYKEPGNFNQINLIASNVYTGANHKIAVKFQHQQDPNSDTGITWYAVVIVAVLVMVIVGVSYGMYLYMKKKNSAKNISLITEKQELDSDEQDEVV